MFGAHNVRLVHVLSTTVWTDLGKVVLDSSLAAHADSFVRRLTNTQEWMMTSGTIYVQMPANPTQGKLYSPANGMNPVNFPTPTQFGVQTYRQWTGGDSATPVVDKPKGPYRYYTTVDKRGRVVTRKFRERPAIKRERRRAPNAYTVNAYRYFNPILAKVTYLDPAWGPSYYTNVTHWDIPGIGSSRHLPNPPSWTANDNLVLVGKLMEKMRGSDFNTAVFLGEAGQSVKMIGDAAFKLAKAYSLARKGNFPAAAKVLTSGRKNVPKLRNRSANSWLELQYGWLPLLSDMRSGAIQVSHLLHVPFVQRYVVRRTLSSIPRGQYSDTKFVYAEAISRVRGQIVAYISEPESLPVLSGLLDPELVAWELIPFSFVADWVAPIGDYLAARAFSRRLKGTFVTTITTNYKEVASAFAGRWGGDAQGSAREEVNVQRTVSSSLAVPMPKVKPLEKVASWKHCANAIALLTQVLKPRKGS